MYSSVNVAVVVRDLARHRFGRAIADDLLHVLALDEASLMILDRTRGWPWEDRVRRRLERALGVERRAHAVLGAAAVGSRSAGVVAWSDELSALEAAPIGGWGELSRWVREDLLEPAWLHTVGLTVARWPRAIAVTVDGLRATYAGLDAGGLSRPWRAWKARHTPAAVDMPEVGAVLAAIRSAGPPQLAMAGAELRARRAGGWSWPVAVHDATWAVELTGRGRLATVAQLAAFAATVDAMGARPPADVVSAVTSAVQATVVADALPADTLAAMCSPLLMHL